MEFQIDDLSLEEKIGQMLIVGVESNKNRIEDKQDINAFIELKQIENIEKGIEEKSIKPSLEGKGDIPFTEK